MKMVYFFMALRVILLLFAYASTASSTCTLPISGQWFRASDQVVVTFTGVQLRGHVITVSSNPYSDLSCWKSQGDKYIFQQEGETDGPSGKLKAYLCWQLVKLSDVSYQLFQLSNETSISGATYNLHFVTVGDADPTIDEVCAQTSDVIMPTLLYTNPIDVGTAATSRQACPNDVIHLTSYVKDSVACPSGQGQDILDGCTGSGVLTNNCSNSLLFSGSGEFSCLTSYSRNAKLYIPLLNMEATVTSSNSRLSCLELSLSGGAGTGKAYKHDCSFTTGAQSLAVSSQATCPSSEGGSSNVGPIVGAVTAAIIVIIAVVVVLVVAYKMGGICKGRKVGEQDPEKVKPKAWSSSPRVEPEGKAEIGGTDNGHVQRTQYAHHGPADRPFTPPSGTRLPANGTPGPRLPPIEQPQLQPQTSREATASAIAVGL